MQPTTSQPNPNQNNIGEIRFASLNPGELDQNFTTFKLLNHQDIHQDCIRMLVQHLGLCKYCTFNYINDIN